MGACTARGAASEKTKLAYGTAIRLYLEWCVRRDLHPERAQRSDIEAWRGEMNAAGAAPGTVMLRLSAVRTLYKALCRAGRCTSNPAEYVKSPKPAEVPVDAVMRKMKPPEQMAAVLEIIEADPRGDRDRAILLTMYVMGLRVSEVQGLDWTDWAGDTLKFRAKGGLTRELAVPDPLKTAFTTLRGPGERSGAMFLGPEGRISVRGIQKMVEARLRAAGIQRSGRGTCSPHAMRHSCAAVAAVHGSSPFAIQDQMGHASQRTTSIYTRVAGRFLEAPSLLVAKALQRGK